MIAVIFEVWIDDQHKSTYLDLAAELRPLLDDIDGFISIERFESIYESGKCFLYRSGGMKTLFQHGDN